MQDKPDFQIAVIAGVLSALGGGSGVWAWLKARADATSDAPSKMTKAASDFQNMLNEHSANFLEDLKEDIVIIKSDNHTLRERLDRQGLEIERLNADNIRCESEANQLKQHVESLENFLRREGINVPLRRKFDRGLVIMEKGRTTTFQNPEMTPQPSTPAPPAPPDRRRKRPPDE